MFADRLVANAEGSRPAAAKVQAVPGGPCQPELFLEAMLANVVLIVSLSTLRLPGLREGEGLEKSSLWLPPPPLLVLLLTDGWDQPSLGFHLLAGAGGEVGGKCKG